MKIISLYNKTKRLINRVVAQDRVAQKEIFEKYSPKMLSICRQYIMDHQSAEAVMLDGFVKMYQNLDKFQHQGSFEGWLRKIMVNECLNYIKKSKRKDYSVALDTGEKELVNTYSEIDIDGDYIQLLVDELPIEMKLVFNFYVIEGYKHSEIAELLDISENASKLRLSKARKIIQIGYNNYEKKSNEKINGL